jgi:hypothetical protein
MNLKEAKLKPKSRRHCFFLKILIMTLPLQNVPGDINKDCKVDFYDFIVMASHWLQCNLDPPGECWK